MAEGTYRVVLVFRLTPGAADEELRRSRTPGSFPDRLAQQPGFLGMELVKLDADRTMSVQAWASGAAWWAALAAVREQGAGAGGPTILEERVLYAGEVVHHRAASGA
ncbi:MAG: antibiotic biosynthesis monooxygenase [Alphaproteobacteria bacterium]|nr:antibiotic biosynthesis monooxygenase [Alphaproteobacteria bacterium]